MPVKINGITLDTDTNAGIGGTLKSSPCKNGSMHELTGWQSKKSVNALHNIATLFNNIPLLLEVFLLWAHSSVAHM